MTDAREIQGPTGTVKVEVRDPREHLQAAWAKGEFFERELLDYIFWHYGGYGGTFIDVGAAIGNHTLYFAAFCKPSIVLSIEPVTESLAHNRRNIYLNRLQDKVLFYPCALGAEVGTGRMVQPNGANLGSYRLETGEDVPVATLDGILEGAPLKQVVLVKIDVEEQELGVLKGATSLLETQAPALFLECRHRGRHRVITDWLATYHYAQVGAPFRGAAIHEFRKHWTP
jgi:FkbM family methyltransferase